jgi:hypothetical protein
VASQNEASMKTFNSIWEIPAQVMCHSEEPFDWIQDKLRNQESQMLRLHFVPAQHDIIKHQKVLCNEQFHREYTL